MAEAKNENATQAQTEKKKLNKENLKKLNKLFSYFRPYKWLFGFSIFLLIIGTVLFLAFPILPGKLIDVAQGGEFLFFKTSESIIYALLIILAIQTVLSYFRVYFFSVISEKSMADLRTDLYKQIILLPMEFYDRSRTGELMSRISSDVSSIQTTFTTTLSELIRQIILLVGGLTAIFIMAPRLSVFMLAVFPVLVIAGYFFGNMIRKLSKGTQDELAKTNIIVEETLQAINTVKSFTSEFFEVFRYKKALKKSVDKAITTSKYRAAFISFILPSILGGYIAVMWYGAKLIEKGELLPGEMLMFILIMGFVGGSIASLGELFGQIQRTIGSTERILEILEHKTEDGLMVDSGNMEELSGDIVFDGVSFAYPTRKDVNVLDNLQFKIEKGKKVALVGGSGGGKSTTVQLLQNLYPLDKGTISVAGININEIGLKRLRGNIGIVPQEVILFGGSIKENILYGKPGASDEEVMEAAKQANAWIFIETFPEGLDTLVGDRGTKLSGGQKQRIAIARAILKNPAILVLDEATSSLDAESEHLVQGALENLMEGRTTLIIAHRLATIRTADMIMVLKGGKIVESGTHDELLSLEEGSYNSLIKYQTEDVSA